MDAVLAQPLELQPLREELSVHPAAPGPDGASRWVIEDPIVHRFYELDWSSFEILRRWSLPPQQIVDEINNSTVLSLDLSDVEALQEYLAKSQLLQSAEGQPLYELWQQGRRSKFNQLLHNYLFFRVPLIRPDRMLARLSPLFARCYQYRFWYLIAAMTLLGLFLVMRQWDQFIGTFGAYGQWQDWIWFGLALVVSKCSHELGHALSAHRYGCRVPTMGVAFLVLWPVLYTDTNEAWKLQSRRARLVIAASGMAAELALATVATMAWSLTPEGPLSSALFFLASTAWVITLGINLNPFMRFDGYFLLSDWLRQPNLHSRAFAVARWWVRRKLFGLGDRPPEALTARTQRFMICFAIGTWLYRFVLFLGIALMVYHLFFKLLGIFLMVLELVWFIGRPIMNELIVWWQRRHDIRSQKRTLIPLVIIAALLVAMLWPWSHTVRAPALIKPQQAQTFYATTPGILTDLKIEKGMQVEAGQVLLRLKSPDIDYEREQGLKEISLLQWQLDHQTDSERLLEQGDLIRERLAQAYSELRRIEAQQQKLVVTAPFAGTVTSLNEALQRGQWVATEEPLLSLAQPDALQVEVLVAETDLGRINPQRGVALYPAQPELDPFRCEQLEVEHLALSELSTGHLASVYGGPVAVNRVEGGRLVPDQGTYRITASGCDATAIRLREQLASAHLASEPYSLLSGLWRRIQGTVIRESGF
ncbi:HlyD family efflux transporter periplasmic adaptor subunit [Pontibacterium sp.]|uniref:HlyD family efflux transporter periplasmic adaptor subunit n=1 Tax=Pontibacterium sp. TaxID=2036026 RepID=UPI003515656A